MKSIKYFTATWCGPCQKFKPIMNEISSEGHSVQFIDIDSQGALAQQYNVRSVPTLVFEQGDSEVNRLIGATTKEIFFVSKIIQINFMFFVIKIICIIVICRYFYSIHIKFFV